jgi:hypothetical protein
MTSVWDDAKRIAGCRREHVKALGVEQLHAIAAAFEGMIDQEISAKKAS